jgi:hypothetical protein
MTEKSSFRISRYINFFKPDEYEIIRRYSVIKFLLTREIVGHHWLPKELLAKIVDISDWFLQAPDLQIGSFRNSVDLSTEF